MWTLILGALAVNAKKEPVGCTCTRDNKGVPQLNGLDGDYGTYCKAWDKDQEYCKGEKYEEWCDSLWCYVGKGCDKAQPSTMKNSTDLYWAYGVCDGEPATCMAYSKPRPKIKPCPDDGGNADCEGKKRAQCNKNDKCMWDKDEKVCVGDGEDNGGGCCNGCKMETPSPPTVKNNMPWGNTQSPDYWYNCVARWCSQYTWMGGPEQCHYETKYGCGCEAMKYDECLNDSECCWGGKESGCQEIVECPRLTFSECLANSDRCSPCGTGGCSYNCKMGPGQTLAGFQSLVLDDQCNCKVTQMF